MRGAWPAGVAAVAAAFALAAQSPAEDPPRQRGGGLDLRKVGDFERPIYAHGPRGAPKLLYVVEREGTIKVMRNGKRRGTFLDIRGLVSCCVSERGLFSVAFAPWRTRRFYVYFTDAQGDLRISEFRRNRGNPLRASEGSRRDLLDIPHRQAANHNGGQLQWGRDGNLYIATGDGGATPERAQDRDSLLGKILRIDPLRRRGPRPYGIPGGNPYADGAGRDEILARGLRNPFRFSFAGRKIVIGDVGESRFEEVDYERNASGANFGWPNYEGRFRRGAALPGHDPPIHVYTHGGGRCGIIGGYVVRDRGLRSLRGRYVYGDLCSGEIRSLKPRLGRARADRSTGLDRGGLVSFGEDARNNVYVVAGGSVWRIVP